jgi:hypothetical protein
MLGLPQGSGSLNAMAVFESAYKDDMTREEAMALVARAIRWGPLPLCLMLSHTVVTSRRRC